MEEIEERCDHLAHALTVGVVVRDVERYHHLMRDARRPLRDQFSRAELMLSSTAATARCSSPTPSARSRSTSRTRSASTASTRSGTWTGRPFWPSSRP
jgi:anti-sigma-K factor RskA